MDAAQHMLRRRRNTFPKAFRQNAVVMNTFFSQVVPSRLENYRKREKALWEDVLPMLTGIEKQFLAPWTGVEDVYWCQNYKSVHRFAIEASISSWCFTIYDLDITVISDNDLDAWMKPWCVLFPNLLLASKLFKDKLELKTPPAGKKRPNFTWRRLQPHEVPQTRKR